jgi:integrase
MGQLRKRGGVWWIRYYKHGRRLEESAHTDKKETARELLKSREGDVADGRPVSVTAKRLRFDDAAADLVTEYTVNARKTIAHLKRRFKKHLTPWFGGRRLVDITTADVRAFTAQRLKDGAAPGEINRELAALKRTFKLAKQAGRFVGDLPHVPMLAEHNIRRGFFERDQFDAVKGHLPAALRPVLEFAYLTGWRLTSEILPLEWRQVDWTGRVVRLDPGTTKNGEGRSFPFTAAIESLLKAQHAEHERLKQPAREFHRGTNGSSNGRIVPYVFHRNGKRIRNVRGAWLTACTDAGLPGRLVHDFRRSAVRNLERDGVSRSAAMAMVGHKTESIYRRYAIVDAGALRDAAAKIDSAAAGTIAGTIGKKESA